MIFVVAGNYRQAHHWMRDNKLSEFGQACYVSGADVLRGQPRGSQYVYVGTFWHHPEKEKIRELLSIMDMVHI